VLALALAQKAIKTIVFEQAPGPPQGLRGENDYSTATLKRYEASRRSHVTMLQKLADEQVLFWNTANPIIPFLRDRVFSTLDRNARLRYRVLSTTAGLRKEPPFGIMDRLMAARLRSRARVTAFSSSHRWAAGNERLPTLEHRFC